MSKLPEPYGSPPGRPGKYAFYISRHGDDDTQTMCVVFAEPYAARKFLDELLKDDGYIWDDECTIRSETGIVVSTRWYPKRMRRCVEHEYSIAEMAWDLDPHVARWARQFRSGPPQPRTLEEDAAHKERAERKASTPRKEAPAGWLHVSDVALSMGIDARDARRALRACMTKPDVGWYFDPKEVEDVKAKIHAELDS